MIDYETYVQIRNYFESDGLNCSQIANALALDQRTVARWANEKQYHLRNSTPRKSKLDPFKNDILRMLEKHPYTAAQIFQRIKENGFDGGSTIVQDYVKKVTAPYKYPRIIEYVDELPKTISGKILRRELRNKK